MRYVVTFYRVDASGCDVVATEHEVPPDLLAAYTAVPGTTLAAIRVAEPTQRIDGFRVVDGDGRLVMDHVGDDGPA